MKIYNSLTRKIEDFEPKEQGRVGMYTCGPTVYSTPTIGNFRTYVLGDILQRTLKYVGYQVKYVMNLTDVGHLTGDNEGDADSGEDRLEKAAKKEGRSAWEVSRAYATEFLEHMKLLSIEMPGELCKATDHIPEQIEMVKKLEEKKFTYRIEDGIYFDTVQFEKMGYKYGELSTLDQVKEGARVEPNPMKKNPRDFALWKFSHSASSGQAPSGERRQMEWDSPWGVGFPGWHIECSAMSTKYLGEQFDIHAGGEDLRSTHHPNEIAQAEGATGKTPFVKYWVHGAFLLVDGGRMGKSLGNAYTVEDVVEQGYDPIALRYFYLTGHYRKQLNFTWEALGGAAQALKKLRAIYASTEENKERTTLSNEKIQKIDNFRTEFEKVITNDLDMPGALAVMWEVAKSNIPGTDKRDLMANFDEVLGLNLVSGHEGRETLSVPPEITELAVMRQKYRQEKNWKMSDQIRNELQKKGYKMEDNDDGSYTLKQVE